MKKMPTKASARLTFFGYLLSATSLVFAGMGPVNEQGMPNEQDFTKMMQELEQATKEMDTFVKSLPPEEQAEFNKVVQQVEKKMLDMDPAVLEKFLTNQMSPEEMDQFLGGVFEGIEPAATEEPKEPMVDEKPKKEKKKKEKPVKKEATKQEQAIELINGLAKTTDSVILKIQAVPELSLKIKRWGKKGVIYDWPKDESWDKVKKEIESLRQDIDKLLDKEPGKDKYKYLDAFIENESLYNNVAKLNTTLSEYEPKITTSGVGIDKVTKDTKTAIKRAISGFTESLYRIKLPAELKKVFDTFEPKATKIREKEEEAKKKPKSNPEKLAYLPPVVAGKAEAVGGDNYGGFGGGYGQDYGMSSYGQQPYGSPSYSGYSQPSYSPPSSASPLPRAPTQGSGRTREHQHKADEKDKSTDEDSTKAHGKERNTEGAREEKQASGKSSGRGPTKKSTPKEEKPVKEVIAKLLAKLEGNFDDIDQLYEQHAMLSQVKTTLLSDAQLDTEFIEEGLKTVIAKLKNAKKIIGEIAEEIKGYNLEDKTRIKADIEKIVKKQAEKLDNTSKEIKDIEDNKATLTIAPINRFFYLGDDSQKETVSEGTPEEFHQFVDRQSFKINNNTALTIFSLAQEWKDLNDRFKADFSTLLPRRRRRQ